MEYIQGLAVQTEIFLYALGFGFLLGILYDVFRTVRMIISNSKGFVFFMDLLYFTVCAFLVFCFNMVVDNGQIKIYVVFGEVAGWFVYYFSFGAIALRISNAVITLVRRLFLLVFKPLRRFSRALKRKTHRLCCFFKKIIKKSDKKTKFNLQKHKGMVYNLYGYIKNSVFRIKGTTDGCNKD
ncbi:MAG: spore cortex biosynthesis protein YabQ [Clostridia bacterium]|nr:spore cortex biosynthesis protein YabQ [Clostridia bacterium]